ncbi:MAG: F-type H+-transporting ATPase subunit delta [Verrucomicrobiales bacterium]|nr:F-type H+-transporting ATPase subunit delta [Verrucomicrobiales bacterium]
MKITKQARRDAKALFQSSKTNGLMDDSKVRQVVQEVIARKPRGYGGILAHFQRLVKLDLDRRNALVESAIPLDAAAQNSIRENLTRTYGPGLNLSFKPNPALIGGLRIKVGSDVYDGSVQAKLAALENNL